jgi:hypothetical protein
MNLKMPVRQVNKQLLDELELVRTDIFPLPGGSGRRFKTPSAPNGVDLRINLSGLTPKGDSVCYYEHIATVRHPKTKLFYIVFRETMDAFYARMSDPIKYPRWLMERPDKISERHIFINQVYKHPSQVTTMNSHEDWLQPITEPVVFDTLVEFLGRKHSVLSDSAYKKLI